MKKIILILFFFILSSSSLNAVAGLACTCNGDWIDNGGLGYVGRPYGPFRSAVQPDPFLYTSTCSDNGTRLADEYRSYVSPTSVDGKDYYRDQFVIISDSCVAYPICDANQTLDTSVIPAICIDAVPPDNNTTQPDSNSTNPDGTCKDGYAPDSLGTCMPDYDGDGVPDLEDMYPRDPNKSSDGFGDDGSCDVPCGTDNEICIVNTSWGNGAVTFIHNWTECGSCAPMQVQDGTPCDGFNPDEVQCPGLELGLNEIFVGDCVRQCLPNHTRDDAGLCQPDELDVPEDCSTPNLLGYTFQSFADTSTSCRLLINSYGGGNGYVKQMNNCSQGNYACYYNLDSSDVNNSLTPDSNSTLGDFDDTNIVNTLDIINDTLNSQTNTLSNKLDELKTVTSQTNDNIRQAVDNQSVSLGSKLDGIKSAIDAKAVTPATDMAPTNDLLQEISDKLSPDITDYKLEISSMESGFSDLLGTSLLTFTTNMDSVKSLIGSSTLPQVQVGSGGCSLNASVFNTQVDLYPSMKTGLLFVAPLLLLIWNIILTVYVIKIAFLAYRDLQFRFLELFKYS